MYRNKFSTLMLAIGMVAASNLIALQAHADEHGLYVDSGDQYGPGSDPQYNPAPLVQGAIVVETPTVVTTVGAFTEPLSPYGSWVASSYGQLWVPNPTVVGVGFRPYATGGHWVYTGYGWTWESEYNWGWAPFHYGRWVHADTYGGWGWVPATSWGPAWVSWRMGYGYVGWTPLAPVGVALAVASYIGWSFVAAGGFLAPRPVFVGYGVYNPFFARTVPLGARISYGPYDGFAGPAPAYISRVGGVPIRPVALGGVRNVGVPNGVNHSFVREHDPTFHAPGFNQAQVAKPGAGQPNQPAQFKPVQGNPKTAPAPSQFKPVNNTNFHPGARTNTFQPTQPSHGSPGIAQPSHASSPLPNNSTHPSFHPEPVHATPVAHTPSHLQVAKTPPAPKPAPAPRPAPTFKPAGGGGKKK